MLSQYGGIVTSYYGSQTMTSFIKFVVQVLWQLELLVTLWQLELLRKTSDLGPNKWQLDHDLKSDGLRMPHLSQGFRHSLDMVSPLDIATAMLCLCCSAVVGKKLHYKHVSKTAYIGYILLLLDAVYRTIYCVNVTKYLANDCNMTNIQQIDSCAVYSIIYCSQDSSGNVYDLSCDALALGYSPLFVLHLFGGVVLYFSCCLFTLIFWQ